MKKAQSSVRQHISEGNNNRNSFYIALNPGDSVYQYMDGSFLPDSQQPIPSDTSIYSSHVSTRFKNVVIGKNGKAQAYDPKNGSLVNTDKKLPELYNKKEKCCGCSACYAICPIRNILPNKGIDSVGKFGERYILPHGAIYMEEDEEGFEYPVVDASLCIRCYKCMEVCPLKDI